MDRCEIVHDNFLRRVAAGDLPAGNPPSWPLTGPQAVAVFRAGCLSRALDRTSRAMQKAGQGFYTIGSSGHEGLAAVADDILSTRTTTWTTLEWVQEVQRRGAGEIVLNVMNQDGMRKGYDLNQLKLIRGLCKVPLIASGGAGEMQHFYDAFSQADVDGALAASVFHKGIIPIPELKAYLRDQGVAIRD